MMFNDSKTNLKICHLNAQSVTNKWPEITNLLVSEDIDILCINETYIKKSKELPPLLDNYCAINKPRKNGKNGGGVAILIKKSINFKETKLTCNQCDNEKTMITCHLGNTKILVGTIYSPKGKICSNLLNKIDSLKTKNKIISGDFNSKHTSWYSNTTNHKGTNLYNAILQTNLTTISQKKYTFKNKRFEDTIDFFLASPEIIRFLNTPTVLQPIGSDHLPLVIEITLENSTLIKTKLIKLHHKHDWDKENNTLLNKYQNKHPTNKKQINTIIKHLTEDIQNINIKTKVIKINSALPEHIRIEIKAKRKLRREWQNTRNPAIKYKLNKLNKKINKLIKKIRKNEYNKKINSINNLKEDPKRTWRNINNIFKLNNKETQNTTLYHNNKEITNTKTINNIFAKQQAKILSKDNTIKLTNIKIKPKTTPLNEINEENPIIQPNQISNKEINTNINNLKTNKAPGPDGITNKTLKYLKTSLTIILTNIFNACITNKYFPTTWKQGKVIMLIKPGKPKDDSNSYRPVTLLDTIGKLLEKSLLNILNKWTSENQLIPDIQAGFRKGRQLNDHHLYFTEDLKKALNRKNNIVAISLDLSKAFDTISHELLINTLTEKELDLNINKTIQSYLRNRNAHISHQNDISPFFPITRGVPQGSILSPSLFNIYMADIPKPPKTIKIIQYADDILIWAKFSKNQFPDEKIQKYLDKITNWIMNKEIKINEDKTQATIFRKYKTIHTPELKISFTKITYKESIKFLGIKYDNNLTFTTHTNDTIHSIQHYLITILKIIKINNNINRENLKNIYQAYVRSKLEFGYPCLMSANLTNQTHLEVQQRKFLRIIYNLHPSTSINITHTITKSEKLSERWEKLKEKHKTLINNTHSLTYLKNFLINTKEFHNDKFRYIKYNFEN